MTVKQIQCLLTYLGYSPGTIDGIEEEYPRSYPGVSGRLRAYRGRDTGCGYPENADWCYRRDGGKGREAGDQHRTEDRDVLGRYPVLYP